MTGTKDADFDSLWIHVAGTNGKGSVCAWMKSAGELLGRKTGVFTSPHLISHTERITVSDEQIPLIEWDRIYRKWEPVFKEKQFTMFEMDLWMALDWFASQKPELILMETGMGGEFDATTALDYDLACITNVGLDHMQYLGDTKEKIAQAKAGVIQEKVPAAAGIMQENLQKIFEERAKEKQAPFSAVQKDRAEEISGFSYEEICWKLKAVNLPAYQADNFLLALENLKMLGLHLDRKQKEELIRRFSWPGRYQILKKEPFIVLDGAHNLHGIQGLTQEEGWRGFERVFFSVLADKQADQMIERLKEKVPELILVDFDSYRLADLNTLAERHGLKTVSLEQMMEELKETDKDTLICGSLYFAGEVLKRKQEL